MGGVALGIPLITVTSNTIESASVALSAMIFLSKDLAQILVLRSERLGCWSIIVMVMYIDIYERKNIMILVGLINLIE